MSEAAENMICLVCNEELEPNDDGVVVVDDLNWHRDCLGYIPHPDHYEYISHDNGHAMMDRFGHSIDMSRLLGSGDEFYRYGGNRNNDGD